MRVALVVTITAALLLLAAPAWAHVTLSADNTEAGGFAVYTVRVPNESDDASTVRVQVQIPDGLEASRVQPHPSWDLTLADGVLTIAGGSIGPGEFDEFRFQARNPEAPGDLTFPAVQTYDDGEEVRWVGEPDSDEPAPVVTITPAAEDEDEGDGTDTSVLPFAALVLGGLGTLLGAAALVRAGR